MPKLVQHSSNGLARWRAALTLALSASSALAGALVFQPAQAAQQPLEYRLVLLEGAPAGWSSRATGINEAGQIVGYVEKGAWAALEQRAVLWDNGIMTMLGSGASSAAYGINNQGQVVGDSGGRAVLWSAGNELLLGAPAGLSRGQAINDAGQIVGGTYGPSGQALRWDPGAYDTYTALPDLGGGWSFANDINEAGQIVGFSWTANDLYHATIWTDGAVTDLDPNPDGPYSEAFGINDRGQVVGFLGSGPSAALWHDGSHLVLSPNDDTLGSAFAINNQGTVVGGDNNFNNDERALMWRDDGTMTVLNSLVDPAQALVARVRDVNDHGWIVGYALNPQNNLTQAFVLIPVPEPATYALLLSGAVVLAAMRIRRRKTEPAAC